MTNLNRIGSLQGGQLGINTGSRWFQRLYLDCKAIDRNIRFKRIKHGFYRIYWRQSYLHECHKEMPLIGYTFEDYDPRFENKSYYEEYEDNADLTMKIKNFREGYYDALGTIRRRCWLMRNNDEFNQRASRAYQQIKVK